MRILLALDGSPAADVARQGVASIALPRERSSRWSGSPNRHRPPDPDCWSRAVAGRGRRRACPRSSKLILDTVAASLERPGIVVHRALLVGRPATLIVDAARNIRAGLVVVGSRGRGALASMVLGSVSAEVVDHAPCPVLVVRRPVDGPTLVAVDGSAPSDAAVTYLVAERLFVDRPVEVLSVAPGTPMPLAFDSTGISDIAVDASGRKRQEAIDEPPAGTPSMRVAAFGPAATRRPGRRARATRPARSAGRRSALRLRRHRHRQPRSERAQPDGPRQRRP